MDSAHAPNERRPRSFRIMLALLYLGALSLLMLWEYHERIEGLELACSLHDDAKGSLYNRPYSWLLNWATPDSAGHVVTVAITSDLEEIQSNVCRGRAYLADLIRAMGTSPSVVVVDKFFNANACASEPASTQELMSAVRGVNAPVVVGESTNGLEEAVAGTCLERKPQLVFPSANVVHGLTRLHAEAERFPLRWPVLSRSSGEGAESVEWVDSLSLAAVKAYDPTFASHESIQRLIRQDDHAYANVESDLPRVTSTDVLCASGDQGVRERWGLRCGARTEIPRLQGKVVVIGSENSTDLETVMNRHMWGFELQGQYIESLLSGDYLRSLPVWFSFVGFGVFVLVIEGVPIILQAYRPRWKKKRLICYAYRQRRYMWVSFWTVALILISAAATLAMRRLPPLELYGDILFVAITRLMYFSAESAEHPFLHAHHTHHKEMARMNKKSTARPLDDGMPKNIDADSDDAPTPLKKTTGGRATGPATMARPGREGGTEG